MKLLLTFFLFIGFNLQSQEYTIVDAKVKTYPKFSSAQKLANKIKNDFDNDSAKIRAVFIWLSENIRYDLKEFYNPTTKRISFQYKDEAEKQLKLQQIKDQIVNETFTKKKSVCEGYAQSFKKICDLLGIEATVIKGYARSFTNDIGKSPTNSNHAWNAVKLNGKWRLIDATWAAGYAINNRWIKHYNNYYFYPNPLNLLRSHLPDETTWQMVEKPISSKTYANQPLIEQGFFIRNLHLISPENGIITKKGMVDFKIKNLKATDLVSYQFKGQRYGKRADLTFEDTIGSFTINLEDKKNTELYIFINNEIALQYKVK